MTLPNTMTDPEAAARAVSLRYVKDTMPGIRRKRRGKGFTYFAPGGERIGDEAVIHRINGLAIPPAYRDVWICPLENGHLQATGRDDRRRKQYRYHPRWEEIRDAGKFERVMAFGESLPKLRRRVKQDLDQRGLPRQRVLAALVAIMERSYIRIGNREYAEENGTYGLTTLRKKHAEVNGSHVIFDFDGKNRTHWHIDIDDPKLARIVRKCEEIPGYELFKYVDEDGGKHYVHSEDLNDYLREATGESFTAKDFRTWAACREAFGELCGLPVPESERQCRIQYNAAVKRVAELLGHTPGICKKSYIAPLLQEHWRSGHLAQWLEETGGAQPAEKRFLAWWRAHMCTAG